MTTMSELENMEVEVDPALAVQVDGKSASTPEALRASMSSAFTTLNDFVQERGLVPKGPPRTIYSSFGPEGTTFTVALPIAPASSAPAVSSSVRFGTLAGGRALRFVHHGPFSSLPATYGRIEQWLRARGAITSDLDWSHYSPMWEEYVTDPATTPEAELRTCIYLPLGWTHTA